MSRPVRMNKALASASANNICASQTPLAAGNLTLNGSAVSGGVATLDTARRVLFTFAANETGHSFVVYGTNATGNPIQETVAGTTAGTTYTSLNFLTVTRISISAAATGAMTVGTNGVGSTPWVMVSLGEAPISQTVAVVVTGTVTYTVQYTYDDFWTPTVPGVNTAIPTAWDDPVLSSKTATGETTFNDPITGWRVTISSGTGSLAITGIQAGISGY